MSYVKVVEADKIPPGTMQAFTPKDIPILLTNIGGRFYAIGNQCTHAGVGLAKGTLEGNIVTCPQNGSQFDVTTGARKRGPAFKNAIVYETKVEGGIVKVKLS